MNVTQENLGTFVRPLSTLERDVLDTISRGCDPLPSQINTVNMLALRGLVVYDPIRSYNAIGFRLTEYGKRVIEFLRKAARND